MLFVKIFEIMFVYFFSVCVLTSLSSAVIEVENVDQILEDEANGKWNCCCDTADDDDWDDVADDDCDDVADDDYDDDADDVADDVVE